MMAALGLFALLLNFIAGVQLAGRPVLLVDTVLSALIGGPVEICGADGVVYVDAAGNPVSGDDKSNHSDSHAAHCLFCLPLLQGNVMLADAAVAMVAPEPVVRPLASVPGAPSRAVQIPLGGAWPQGPPMLLIA